MEIVGKTNQGLVRNENQDDFYISQQHLNQQYIVVCDGMGGANAGSVASKLSIDYIKEYIEHHDLGEKDKEVLLTNAIFHANQNIFMESGKNKEYFGMGTTVVLAYFSEDQVFISHVGDSRVYLLREKMDLITVDHSMVQDMVEKGTISKEEAKNHPQKNIITRALGVNLTVEPDIDIVSMEPGDIFLLCTDGLSSVVEEEVILQIIQNHSLEVAADKLIEQANLLGGPDNITVILVKN